MATAIAEKTEIAAVYQAARKKLEDLERQCGIVRQKLIEAIKAEGKVVLSENELKSIREYFAEFEEVQTKLGGAFFEEADASAKYFWECGAAAEEFEPLLV
jgi:hypothetical protein